MSEEKQEMGAEDSDVLGKIEVVKAHVRLAEDQIFDLWKRIEAVSTARSWLPELKALEARIEVMERWIGREGPNDLKAIHGDVAALKAWLRGEMQSVVNRLHAAEARIEAVEKASPTVKQG